MTARGATQKRLTPDEVRFIRQVQEIASVGKLAHKLGRHRMTIYRVWSGETHRKVDVARGDDARVGA